LFVDIDQVISLLLQQITSDMIQVTAASKSPKLKHSEYPVAFCMRKNAPTDVSVSRGDTHGPLPDPLPARPCAGAQAPRMLRPPRIKNPPRIWAGYGPEMYHQTQILQAIK